MALQADLPVLDLVELALLEATVAEASALLHDVGSNEATARERTAAAAFLAQF